MFKEKSIFIATGAIALFCGFAIIMGFILLKFHFGYPEIIRATPDILLKKLYATINIVPYLYYGGIGMAGVGIVLFSALLGKILYDRGEEVFSSLGKVCGIIAGVLLYAGIVRYSILFPNLAIMRESALYNNETIDLIFKAMNTYIGDSIAEHVQFTFSSLMFLFFGISIIHTSILPKWIAIIAIITTVVIIIGNFEQFGFKFAFVFNRVAALMLALWFCSTGILLIFKKR